MACYEATLTFAVCTQSFYCTLVSALHFTWYWYNSLSRKILSIG